MVYTLSVLRPKYSLDKSVIQGDRITVPAGAFTELTTRRYPYPRVGTRAPNGMFPYIGRNNPLEIVAEKAHYGLGNGNPYPEQMLYVPNVGPYREYGEFVPNHEGGLVRMPYGYVRPMGERARYAEGSPYARAGVNPGLVRTPYGYVEPPIPRFPGIQPHYTLNKSVVEGVMSERIYTELTGKHTTEPTLPPSPPPRVAGPLRTPTLEVDWSSVFWGFVAGGVVTLGMAYGVIPALAEAAAKAVRKR